jgi:hypothetical protein
MRSLPTRPRAVSRADVRRDGGPAATRAQSDQPENVPGNPVDRAFRSTVGRESTTFGLSILVTVTYGVDQGARGSPDTLDLMLYATGAVMSFTILELAFSRAAGRRCHSTRPG